MIKSELRAARKAAHAAGQPLVGELAIGPQSATINLYQPPRRTRRGVVRERHASKAEQRALYLDCGPAAWDDIDSDSGVEKILGYDSDYW